MSTFHMGINDALIALCCLFWVEVAYKIYHKERNQKYKDEVNQSLDDPYLSSKMVAISSGISFLIICIATFLQEQFEPYGVVGRVGGDEFAVMIEEEMSQEALEEELEQFFQNISGIQQEVTVSCSIGVYRFTYPKTIKELLTKTDEILYEAKANGRGCFVIR